MTIGIANDHHGIELKNKIIKYLDDRKIKYVNYGANEETTSDYVDYAVKLCKGINSKDISLGILICGTGIGMSVAANKIHGIIAAKVNTPKEAHLCKEHNMANVMTLAEYTENLNEILDEFINTKHSKEERHHRRIDKIMRLK